ncbi:uncharacterized protein LOC143471229 isoform X2 [Clavelina lepadiformis]|uniref:uncharacterized protein LOC143471229 isoform X2 n=1 Tax=Clavelina lepadiformis TaxID=159417 RepID=UPI0040425786
MSSIRSKSEDSKEKKEKDRKKSDEKDRQEDRTRKEKRSHKSEEKYRNEYSDEKRKKEKYSSREDEKLSRENSKRRDEKLKKEKHDSKSDKKRKKEKDEKNFKREKSKYKSGDRAKKDKDRKAVEKLKKYSNDEKSRKDSVGEKSETESLKQEKEEQRFRKEDKENRHSKKNTEETREKDDVDGKSECSKDDSKMEHNSEKNNDSQDDAPVKPTHPKAVGGLLKRLLAEKDKYYLPPSCEQTKLTIFTDASWEGLSSMEGIVSKPKRSNVSLEYPTDIYRCAVCKVTCTNESCLDSHLKGKKHIKMVKKAEHGMILYSPEIDTLETDEDIRMRQEIIEYAENEPVIGVEYIIKFKATESVESFYLCKLCKARADTTTLLSHISGQRHRLKYLKEHHFPTYCDITGFPNYSSMKSSSLSKRVKHHAATIMEDLGGAKGIGKIEIRPAPVKEEPLSKLAVSKQSKDIGLELLEKDRRLKEKEQSLKQKERFLFEKAKVQQRFEHHQSRSGFNPDYIDKNLSIVISQRDDRHYTSRNRRSRERSVRDHPSSQRLSRDRRRSDRSPRERSVHDSFSKDLSPHLQFSGHRSHQGNFSRDRSPQVEDKASYDRHHQHSLRMSGRDYLSHRSSLDREQLSDKLPKTNHSFREEIHDPADHDGFRERYLSRNERSSRFRDYGVMRDVSSQGYDSAERKRLDTMRVIPSNTKIPIDIQYRERLLQVYEGSTVDYEVILNMSSEACKKLCMIVEERNKTEESLLRLSSVVGSRQLTSSEELVKLRLERASRDLEIDCVEILSMERIRLGITERQERFKDRKYQRSERYDDSSNKMERFVDFRVKSQRYGNGHNFLEKHDGTSIRSERFTDLRIKLENHDNQTLPEKYDNRNRSDRYDYNRNSSEKYDGARKRGEKYDDSSRSERHDDTRSRRGRERDQTSKEEKHPSSSTRSEENYVRQVQKRKVSNDCQDEEKEETDGKLSISIKEEKEIREKLEKKIFNALKKGGSLGPIAKAFVSNPALQAALKVWELKKGEKQPKGVEKKHSSKSGSSSKQQFKHAEDDTSKTPTGNGLLGTAPRHNPGTVPVHARQKSAGDAMNSKPYHHYEQHDVKEDETLKKEMKRVYKDDDDDQSSQYTKRRKRHLSRSPEKSEMLDHARFQRSTEMNSVISEISHSKPRKSYRESPSRSKTLNGESLRSSLSPSALSRKTAENFF